MGKWGFMRRPIDLLARFIRLPRGERLVLLVAAVRLSLARFGVGLAGVARTRITDRGLEAVDLVAGTGLVLFGGLLGLRALRDE